MVSERASLRLRLGSSAKDVSSVRSYVRSFLQQLGAARVEDAMLCLTEACTNALRHAQGSPISLEVRVEDVDLVVVVRDYGTGIELASVESGTLPSAFAASGRGMGLMTILSDEVNWWNDNGTVVKLVLRGVVPEAH